MNFFCFVFSLLIFFSPKIILSQSINFNSDKKKQSNIFLTKPNLNHNELVKDTRDNSLINVFLKSLIIIVTFLILIYFLFRWFKRSAFFSSRKDKNYNKVIKILSSKSISSSKLIQLVKIYSRIYIIGVSDNSISLIGTIDDVEEIKQIINLCSKESKNNENKSFKNVLNQFFTKNNKNDHFNFESFIDLSSKKRKYME